MEIKHLVKSIIQKVLWLTGILSILVVLLIEQRWYVFIGLLLGAFFGILRFITLAAFFISLLQPENNQTGKWNPVFGYLLSILALGVLLVATAMYDVFLFGGFTAGILLVPAVITLMGIMKGFEMLKK